MDLQRDDRWEGWVRHLRSLAEPVIHEMDVETEWERGRRRPESLLAPLLAWRLDRAVTAPDGPLTIDVALWWGLVSGGPEEALARIDLDAGGALAPQSAYTTLEVWTEAELAGLHALFNISRTRPDDHAIADRLRRTIDWHIENTQPDNATNHAWALHAFLMRGIPESTLFAETLLSNCMVLNARPDPLSAWILLDAAEELERSAGAA